MREAGPYLGLGVQFALTMAFFTLSGYGLDYWLGTSPWLTIGGALIGMTALFIQLFRMAGTLGSKKNTSSKRASSGSTPPPRRPRDA